MNAEPMDAGEPDQLTDAALDRAVAVLLRAFLASSSDADPEREAS
jgi:hypothetical protein